MKRNRVRQHNVGTSHHNLLAKPYGFCCDIKDQDPQLLGFKNSMSLFPLRGPISGGPDIKIRIQENDDDLFPRQRSVQRSAQRGFQRGVPRSLRINQRNNQVTWGNYRGNRFGARRITEPSGERMICKRCRGPLQWYLEDEVATAREIMISKRRKKYHADMEKNIKIAKMKVKRKKKKGKLSRHEEGAPKEDVPKEDESKQTT